MSVGPTRRYSEGFVRPLWNSTLYAGHCSYSNSVFTMYMVFLHFYLSKWQAFKLATLSGLAEPLGVIIVGLSLALNPKYIDNQINVKSSRFHIFDTRK